MSKREFKVGERVAYYHGRHRYAGGILSIDKGILCISDGMGWVHVHPKQCRRLVSKKRRTVWISEMNLINVFNADPGHTGSRVAKIPTWGDNPELSGMVEFREVGKEQV
jgi:hypothetical protein